MDEIKLTKEQFANAASTAVRAVLDLYGEVDALLRELDGTMRANGFQAWSVIPGSKKADTNRILREWKGRLYVGASGDEGDEEEDAEEIDAPEEDEAEVENGRRSGPREIPQGSAVAFVRARVYRARELAFQPEILYGVLTEASAPIDGLDPDEPLRLQRGSIRRILAPLEVSTTVGKELRTSAPVIAPKGRKMRASNRPLCFNVPEQFEAEALYDIDSLERVQAIAQKLLEKYARLSPA